MSRFIASLPRHWLGFFGGLLAAGSLPLIAEGQAPVKRAKVDDKNTPMYMCANQMTGRLDRDIKMDGNVELIRGETKLTADLARFYQVEDEVEASGQIRIVRFGDTYTGDTLKLNLDSGQGVITHPTYRLLQNNGQGKAERVDFINEDQANIIEGTYSTCEGPNPDWYLKADTMRLDTGKDIGVASKAIVYFKGVPILGTPTMSFPLTSARSSGILPPTYGYTTTGGMELAVPYYFNIAPNRDLTLYPKIITRRGLQLGANGRYLGKDYFGESNIEFLPNDQITKSNRYKLSSTHDQRLKPGFTYGWNINTASDDAYAGDFATSITSSTLRQLVREVRTDYAEQFWGVSARLQNYQILQDSAALLNPGLRIDRPYDRLPQINFHAGRDEVMGFDWSLDSELTRFWHPDKVRGERLVVNPQIVYPFIRPGYFVKPKLALHASAYKMADAAVGPNSFSRVLPMFSIDSGLILERDTTFFGAPATQTLEPRLFYVNIPYRDQSLYPNFDTAEAGFNFSQIFSENRFTGADRINDANQITAALVSRYLEPSGAERMRFAIGQRFYFRQQRVVLDASAPTSTNNSRSDLLLSANGRLSSVWTMDSAIQYSESERRLSSANYGTQWKPAAKSVLNAEYRYLRANFEQLNLSSQWPIGQHFYAVGRVSYSLPERKTTEGLAGIEYNADCWVFRLAGQRFATATKDSTTAIFIQLELNGLSRLGSNPLDALNKNIPGYQLVNRPNR